MKFHVYKYPRLNFYGLVGIFSFMIAMTTVMVTFLLAQQTKQTEILIFFFGICILCFTIPLALILRLKADYFAEFFVDSEGITIYHAKNGTHKIFWSEIADSGIFQKDYEASFSHPKFVYFSKTKLSEKDFLRLNCRASATILCTQYDDEILFTVKKYFPLCLDVKNVKIPRLAKKD